MTAFARVQKQLEMAQLCWEVRSVNHRYLDVSFRLPESFRFIEPQLRNALRGTIQRGKLECQLKFQDISANNQSMLINIGMVNALVDLGANLSSSHHLANDLTVSKVLAWPGIVQAAQCDMENLAEHALNLFNDAIAQLSLYRATEGSALQDHIVTRLEQLNSEIQRAKLLISSLSASSKDKLLTRLQSIQLDVPEGRVEQEIALILARLDVTEELDRLQTHCIEVKKALYSEQGAGRRLDFLMQELNREANTLSSKSDSSELTKCAIEMKVLIEQMREQIQNIE
jgi:uncharacterized protein (TIGR00255 family)